MSVSSQSNIEMDNPSRLMKRICRHWSHKLDVEFDDESGHTFFENGAAYFTVFPECLSIHLKADNQEGLIHLKDVLERHLMPMAKPEEITITWI